MRISRLKYLALIDCNSKKPVSPLDILAEEHDAVVGNVTHGDDQENEQPEPEEHKDLLRHPVGAQQAEVVGCLEQESVVTMLFLDSRKTHLLIPTSSKLTPCADCHDGKYVSELCDLIVVLDDG